MSEDEAGWLQFRQSLQQVKKKKLGFIRFTYGLEALGKHFAEQLGSELHRPVNN